MIFFKVIMTNDEFQALNESDQKQIKEFLTKTGCGELIAEK